MVQIIPTLATMAEIYRLPRERSRLAALQRYRALIPSNYLVPSTRWLAPRARDH
jgi:hypothetical protein